MVAYDFEDYTDVINVSSTNVKTISGEYFEIEVYPSRQKCQAIKFKISDNGMNSVATNRALAISSLDLLIGLKNTNNKLSAGHKTSTV
jgi:hypothetical protein